MAQHNRNNWHHIPGIGGIMATGLSTKIAVYNKICRGNRIKREMESTAHSN